MFNKLWCLLLVGSFSLTVSGHSRDTTSGYILEQQALHNHLNPGSSTGTEVRLSTPKAPLLVGYKEISETGSEGEGSDIIHAFLIVPVRRDREKEPFSKSAVCGIEQPDGYTSDIEGQESDISRFKTLSKVSLQYTVVTSVQYTKLQLVASDGNESDDADTGDAISDEGLARFYQEIKGKVPKSPIKSGRALTNEKDVSIASEGWMTQAAGRKVIDPIERILKRVRNPAISQLIRDINKARAENDRDKEALLYAAFGERQSDFTLGFERVLEEQAWFHLHEFDGVYSDSEKLEQLRPEIQEKTRMTREKFIVPAMGYVLGFDQLNSEITPTFYWDQVQNLLADKRLDELSKKIWVIYRLRCLAATMAHSLSFSLLSSWSLKCQDLTREWYHCRDRLRALEDSYKRVLATQSTHLL